jgi:hypothetical protein
MWLSVDLDPEEDPVLGQCLEIGLAVAAGDEHRASIMTTLHDVHDVMREAGKHDSFAARHPCFRS